MNTNTITKTKGRDSRVELLRLFACLCVLMLHFKPGSFVNGQRLFTRVFFTCLCTDAVGVFLFITGFFYFGNQNYSKRITTYLKSIFLPTVLYILFISLVYPVLVGSRVSLSTVSSELITTVTTWNPITHNAQHLWYMFLHGLIVLAFPVLAFIKQKLLVKDWQKAIFLLCVFCFLAINDYSGNRLLNAQMVPVTVLIPGCLYTLSGITIYEKRDIFRKNILWFFGAVAVYGGVNLIRARYMTVMLNANSSASHLYGWYTCAGFLCVISLSVAILSLKPFVNTFINKIASTTMDVYILHVVVSEVISDLGVKAWIISTFLNGSEALTEYLKFSFIYSTVVFLICCSISLIAKKLIKFIRK